MVENVADCVVEGGGTFAGPEIATVADGMGIGTSSPLPSSMVVFWLPPDDPEPDDPEPEPPDEPEPPEANVGVDATFVVVHLTRLPERVLDGRESAPGHPMVDVTDRMALVLRLRRALRA